MRTRHLTGLLAALALATAACGGAVGSTTTASPSATSPSATATPAVTETAVPATDAPTDPASTTARPAGDDRDCSTRGARTDGADLDRLPAAARDTATFLLDAATRCDEQLLATAAAESETTLSFGGVDPYEAFGLPDGDERYVALVTLLTEVPHAAEADDATPATFVWPRVATDDWQDDDAAWQEVVDAGLLSADEATSMREAGSGYLGWRLGIRGDGTWMFLVAGD